MRVAIANFSPPVPGVKDFWSDWQRFTRPAVVSRLSLFEQPRDWGFHVLALGVYLLDRGLASQVEYWDYAKDRGATLDVAGVLRLTFLNETDLRAYLEVHGPPDLFINYGRLGLPVLRLLDGRCFRVDVPCLRFGRPLLPGNHDAECYLVDDDQFLDDRSMLYVPVVDTQRFVPGSRTAARDFIYLAADYPGKRHDLLIAAVRGTALTGHLHPVDGSRLNLEATHITTSGWNEGDVVQLLQTSRIAVYPGDETSNPAAMWECVAAGLPIIVNQAIRGGKHIVVPGITGELAGERDFRSTMEYVLKHRDRYQPRAYFDEHWGTLPMLRRYLQFFVRMGWDCVLPPDLQ